jgi:hypothetical protein
MTWNASVLFKEAMELQVEKDEVAAASSSDTSVDCRGESGG